MAYTPLPFSLSTRDRRSVLETISDIRSGTESGQESRLYRYCPMQYVRDEYVPPNLDYSNCFLHSNTTPVNSGGPSLKKLISTRKGKATEAQVVNGVLLTPSRLQHTISGHSVVASAINFQNCRMKPMFKIVQVEHEYPGNSVFISTSMVEGLVKHTISLPDKISPSRHSPDRVVFQRSYKTEIGHNASGCCHVVKVVVQRCQNSTLVEKGVLYELITAFPDHAFSPSL